VKKEKDKKCEANESKGYRFSTTQRHGKTSEKETTEGKKKERKDLQKKRGEEAQEHDKRKRSFHAFTVSKCSL